MCVIILGALVFLLFFLCVSICSCPEIGMKLLFISLSGFWWWEQICPTLGWCVVVGWMFFRNEEINLLDLALEGAHACCVDVTILLFS